MTLVPVESLPKRTIHGRNDVEKLVKDFVDSGMKIARIDYYAREYKCIDSLYVSVRYAIERLGISVKVCMRNKEAYLIRL